MYVSVASLKENQPKSLLCDTKCAVLNKKKINIIQKVNKQFFRFENVIETAIYIRNNYI